MEYFEQRSPFGRGVISVELAGGEGRGGGGGGGGEGQEGGLRIDRFCSCESMQKCKKVQ